MPGFLQERLGPTVDQKKQIESLQKDVDEKLGKILTAEQMAIVKEMGEHSPFRRGREGGFGRPGGESGRPTRPLLERS